RRLAAILAADVVGYSRLMAQYEAGTLARLQAHRRELLDPKINEHSGRVVKLMGDGALIEFASVVDAVECAIAIQLAMREINAGSREDQRIVVRIGINLGDIIIEGDSTATASMSRHGSKPSPNLAASRFPRMHGGRRKARWPPTSLMQANRALRTWLNMCASI